MDYLKINKIKVLRKHMGLSQVQLSRAAKVSRKSLVTYENGKGNPTSDTLTKLAKALNCEIKDLL